jgi:ribose 5-phosphate isomerase B
VQTKTRVAVAADHAGFELKNLLKSELERRAFDVTDFGTDGPASVDYPDFGAPAAAAVASGKADIGVLVCGSGIGMSIVANRLPKVRAALCQTVEAARLARQHNDANVLALGARMIDAETAKLILDAFLTTPFEGGRHAARVAKLGQSKSDHSKAGK